MRVAGLILVLVAAGSSSTYAADTPPGGYRAGVAVTDIMPDYPVRLAGEGL